MNLIPARLGVAFAFCCFTLAGVGCDDGGHPLDPGGTGGKDAGSSTGGTTGGSGGATGGSGGSGGSKDAGADTGQCPQVKCAIACPNGYQKDGNGCQTCLCNPAPICADTDCGAIPPMAAAGAPGPNLVPVPPPMCPTGQMPGLTCTRVADHCAWVQSCKPVACPKIACDLACPNGYKKDANGCTLCECATPVMCGPVCDIFCQYGNVLDDKGCPTCKCNPPPTCKPLPCPSGAPFDPVTCTCVPTAATCSCPAGTVCIVTAPATVRPTPGADPGAPAAVPAQRCEKPDATCTTAGRDACACLAPALGMCAAGRPDRTCACDGRPR